MTICRELKQASGYKEIDSYVLQTVKHVHSSQTQRLYKQNAEYFLLDTSSAVDSHKLIVLSEVPGRAGSDGNLTCNRQGVIPSIQTTVAHSEAESLLVLWTTGGHSSVWGGDMTICKYFRKREE